MLYYAIDSFVLRADANDRKCTDLFMVFSRLTDLR